MTGLVQVAFLNHGDMDAQKIFTFVIARSHRDEDTSLKVKPKLLSFFAQ